MQPTFEDLSIDDNLSELQRLVRYSRSAIGLQRLVHVKMLTDVAQSVGFRDTNLYILPLLGSISYDPEPAVRQHLMEQLSILAKFCCDEGDEGGYSAVLNSILPVIAVALEDDKPEVRHAACTSLVIISKLVRSDDLGQHVLTIILTLAHEDEKEDRRMTAAELLNSLAENLGMDLCKQFVIPEVVSLAEDPVFRVRKATALNFHNICKVGGEFELFERLMPAFVRLSKDDMYRVRRACADSIAEIAKYVSDDIRVGVLSEIYLRLTQDPSKLVKQSTLQQSGIFIASLPSKAVNENILGNYCSMAMSPTGDASADAELRRYCAFSFPAVLQTIGVGRWHEVRELYHALVQSRSNSVKQTLACSLHEVALILSCANVPNNQVEDGDEVTMGGMALVEEELLSVFESMLQDVEAIQMGVMRHLSDFLSVLSVPCRVSYLPLLHDILHSTNPFNWRLRQCLAMQISVLSLLSPPELLFNTLFPLVMTLLQDPVASVRRDSFTGVAKMLMILSHHADSLSYAANLQINSQAPLNRGANNAALSILTLTSYPEDYNINDSNGTNQKKNSNQLHQMALTAAHHVDIMARAINTLILGKTYQLRQLWAELCLSLLLEITQPLFEKYFLDGLLYLSSDPVSNVRVAVGVVFTGWGSENEPTLLNIDKANTELKNESVENDTEAIKIYSPWDWLLKRPDIQECIVRLSKDDKDVYLSILKLQDVFPNMSISMMSCRGLKEAPGGSVPVPNMVTGVYLGTSCQESDVSSFKSEYEDESVEDGDEELDEAVRTARRDSLSSSSEGNISLELPAFSVRRRSSSGSSTGSPTNSERNGSYGVKSPGRGLGFSSPPGISVEQQEEEMETERLLNMKKSNEEIDRNSLDVLMREEAEKSQAQAVIRPRGMSLPGEIVYNDYPDEDEEEELTNTNTLPPTPPILFVSPLSSPHSSRKYAELDADTLPSSPDGSPSKWLLPSLTQSPPGEEGQRGSPTLEEFLPLSYIPSSLDIDIPNKTLNFEEGTGPGPCLEDTSLIDPDSNTDNTNECAVLTSVLNIDNNIAENLSPS